LDSIWQIVVDYTGGDRRPKIVELPPWDLRVRLLKLCPEVDLPRSFLLRVYVPRPLLRYFVLGIRTA